VNDRFQTKKEGRCIYTSSGSCLHVSTMPRTHRGVEVLFHQLSTSVLDIG